MKTTRLFVLVLCAIFAHIPLLLDAQVNSGSNGSDGALNIPSGYVAINMSDHPDGIYQYTSVNIGGSVGFVPNAKNTPVVWLVQGDCMISGTVVVSGADPAETTGAPAGPGGFRGGNSGSNASAGQGPGGGAANTSCGWDNASYGSVGQTSNSSACPAPSTYGNIYVLPLVGGSGGGGITNGNFLRGGGGGGGALLIAAGGKIVINGAVYASGGGVYGNLDSGGGGSGGAIRLVATQLGGTGTIQANGGQQSHPSGVLAAGNGRVRLDIQDNNFGGNIVGVWTQGFQPIIIPAAGQGAQLAIQSVAGNAVSSSPSGILSSPDVIIPAQINNPVPIVVSCTNIPLNSEVTVTVHPANGSDVQAVGTNNTGTSASSTATISLNLPRGGGIIYASVVTGINGGGGTASTGSKNKIPSYAYTGLTTFGERFVKIETKAFLGGKQETTFITASGKRYSLR